MSDEKKQWGTKPIEAAERFEGTVMRAEWETGKAWEDGSEPKEQLVIEIQPHIEGYEGENFLGWYPYAQTKRSKWFHLQKALEACGVSIRSEADLIGKRFLWERRDISFGKNRQTDEEIVSRGVLLPVNLVGSGGKAPAPAKPAAPAAPKGETAPTPAPAASEDADAKILEFVKNNPGTKDEITAGTGLPKSKVIAVVSKLKKAGKLKEEDGCVMVAD